MLSVRTIYEERKAMEEKSREGGKGQIEDGEMKLMPFPAGSHY